MVNKLIFEHLAVPLALVKVRSLLLLMLAQLVPKVIVRPYTTVFLEIRLKIRI